MHTQTDTWFGKRSTRRRRLFFSLLATCISVFATAAVAEIYLRVMRPSSDHTEVGSGYYNKDKKLGWRPMPNLNRHFQTTDKDVQPYTVDYSTNKYGFRYWGDLDSPRGRKLLCLGDSFTADPFSSDSEAYFGYLAKHLPVEVFAIGGSGYGTLQELMLLEEFHSLIEPDMLLLQFCNNDFWNNSYEGESQYFATAQKNRRPYLINGHILYRLSPYHPWNILSWSHLFRRLDVAYQRIQARRLGIDKKNFYDSKRFTSLEMFRETDEYKKTDLLFSMIQQAFPKTTGLYTFNVDSSSVMTLAWEEIAQRHGFTVISGVGDLVRSQPVKGATVYARDGAHWNNLGHQIAGRLITNKLRDGSVTESRN